MPTDKGSIFIFETVTNGGYRYFLHLEINRVSDTALMGNVNEIIEVILTGCFKGIVLHLNMYMYICVCVCVYIYIYI